MTISHNGVLFDREFWRHIGNAKRGVHSHDPYEDDVQVLAVETLVAYVERDGAKVTLAPHHRSEQQAKAVAAYAAYHNQKKEPRDSFETPARNLDKGMGQAVGERTILRKRKSGMIEDWADVARRVAVGNASLVPDEADYDAEFHGLHHHLRQASLLMSGRHLQHGDWTQEQRQLELFTNCSTAATSFMSFALLLSGSGVGRSYDDAMMKVDWAYMPLVVCTIDMMHPDKQSGEITAMTKREALHLYADKKTHIHDVADSREGWAKAIEKIEVMAFKRVHRRDVLILDFSGVRHRGQPIKGMQNRPASGPGPLMAAIANAARVRDAGMEPWRQAMYVDHYLAECVLVGGARRAARMATKSWRDPTVLDFVNLKRGGGVLWSANNSVLVDAEFWELSQSLDDASFDAKRLRKLRDHAKSVYDGVVDAAYHDKTGEPGLVNVDKLVANDEGIRDYIDGDYIGSRMYRPERDTRKLLQELALAVINSPYTMIVNPCGEVPIVRLGAYCTIASSVPYHAQNDDDAEDSFRVATRALIRVNLMDAMYGREVRRTNRIAVGLTGSHEWAWSRFGYAFRDIIDEQKSLDFWLMLSRFARAIDDEAERYSAELGVVAPHTNRMIAPNGTISKLFGLTEGAHLPAVAEFLRWVQFRNDDPLIEDYRLKGYPIRRLQTYAGTTIVGFPTKPLICTLGLGDKLVTAQDATPEEQYQYLRLLEKYWIRGVEEDGVTLRAKDTGGQASYTLKYDPNLVSYEEFRGTFAAGQSSVRCCSVMPITDTSGYEYLPEQMLGKGEYEVIIAAIQDTSMKEDVGREHLECTSGSCPISFGENSASKA